MSKIEVKITGLRGSGKSTVLTIIANILKLHGYSVYFNNISTQMSYRPEVLDSFSNIKYSENKVIYLTEE